MISSFKLRKKDVLHEHEAAIPFLRKKIQFKQGLNIVFGPNGSGKSTLLNIIARQMFSLQSGRSVITKMSLDALCKGLGESAVASADIAHDGQSVMHVDPRLDLGIAYGELDEDFSILGIKSTLDKKQSTGQRSSGRISDFIRVVMEGRGDLFPDEIESKLKMDQVNDLWQSRLKSAFDLVKPSIERGQKTILMDEPESGFSMIWQWGLWGNIFASEEAKRFQIIVATHSPFALAVPGAHYIETEPGYRDKCLEAFADLNQQIQLLGKK